MFQFDRVGIKGGAREERTVEYLVSETCVQADVLEKRYRVASRRADGRREDPVRGGACEPTRDEFEGYVCMGGVNINTGAEVPSLALSNVHDKGSGDGRCVDPFTGEVLDLETRVGGCLE